MCLAALTGNTAITWGWQSIAPMHLDSCDVYGASRSGGGGCDGGYTSLVWAAFSDSEGYRPEHCYPYAYDGNAAAHYTETVDVIFTCAEAYAARTDVCTGADDYKVQVRRVYQSGSLEPLAPFACELGKSFQQRVG